MKKKKLYEMTPEEQAALTPDELEEKVFDMVKENSSNKQLLNVMIKAHAKEKALRGRPQESIYARFFYCDLEESAAATHRIAQATLKAVEKGKRKKSDKGVQKELNNILRILIDYAHFYADMLAYDYKKIVDDVSIFIDALELTENKKGEMQIVLHAPIADNSGHIRLGWALNVKVSDEPKTKFDAYYNDLTAAVEIALLALWKVFAPREAFTSVYAKIAEKAAQYCTPERDIKEYTEKNENFDFWLEDDKPESTQEPDTEPRTDIISIAAKRAKEIQYPTDKINYMAFNLPGRKDINGQLRFDGEFKINVGKRGEPATVLYNIQFSDNDVSISQKLEPYDKRVQIAAGTLWKEYGEYFTLKQLYHAMGNDGQPGAGEFTKMLNSMKKQLTAEIQITNEDEAKKQKRRTKFVYSGALLPYETITAEVNGKIQDGVIHLLREPPLIEFARQRKQITTIPRAVLTTPISQTNDNLAIEDYVIERINMMKHDQEKNRKILIKSVNEHCLITATKQKQRTKDKILKLLDYYTKIGYIKGFEQLTDAFLLDI